MISISDYLSAVKGLGIVGISLIVVSVMLMLIALVCASRGRVAQTAHVLAAAWLPILLLFLLRVFHLKALAESRLFSEACMPVVALNVQNGLFAIYLPVLLSVLVLLMLLIRRPAEALRHTALYVILLLLATHICLIMGYHFFGALVQHSRSNQALEAVGNPELPQPQR